MLDGKVKLGSLDTVYLTFYAIGLFFSGHIADRSQLNVFLAIGMVGSGIFVVTICFHTYFGLFLQVKPVLLYSQLCVYVFTGAHWLRQVLADP